MVDKYVEGGRVDKFELGQFQKQFFKTATTSNFDKDIYASQKKAEAENGRENDIIFKSLEKSLTAEELEIKSEILKDEFPHKAEYIKGKMTSWKKKNRVLWKTDGDETYIRLGKMSINEIAFNLISVNSEKWPQSAAARIDNMEGLGVITPDRKAKILLEVKRITKQRKYSSDWVYIEMSKMSNEDLALKLVWVNTDDWSKAAAKMIDNLEASWLITPSRKKQILDEVRWLMSN